MQITEPFIQYWARGEQSSEKGRSLSGGFSGLFVSDDGLCLWADYPGSQDGLYRVYADLRDDTAPRFACSCPSRQNPCKHALALLWARLLAPEDFIPDKQPPEWPSPAARKPKAVRLTPLALGSQALGTARQILASLLREGLDAWTPALLRQKRKQLQGLHVLPGVRYALLGILADLDDPAGEPADILRRIADLCVLLERADSQALSDDGQALPPDWELDTLLGRVWRFEDLKTLGYIRHNVNLVQLAFWSEDDAAARRYTDMALWADAATAQIYETHHHRPYDATRHIPPEDSSHAMLCVESMVFYPGTDRVRWNACRPGPITPEACRNVCAAAFNGIQEAADHAIGKMKAHIPCPAALVRFRDIGYSGKILFVRDIPGIAFPLRIPPSAADVLQSVYNEDFTAVLLRFYHHHTLGLCAKPMALVSEERVQRL